MVYAGLLPALAESRYFDKDYWLIRTMRPGPQPAEALVGVLGSNDKQSEFEPDTVDALLKAHPPAQRLLLYATFHDRACGGTPGCGCGSNICLEWIIRSAA